jgi:hypothetical protein
VASPAPARSGLDEITLAVDKSMRTGQSVTTTIEGWGGAAGTGSAAA